jgi:hypothetical protein
MKNENNISDNLENEAPLLSKIKKENNFNAPKNYFESLPEVMSNKNLDNKSLYFIFDKMSWRVLMPFTAAIIISISIITLNTIEENNTLTPDQLSEYIITEDNYEFDDETVYDAYAEFIETDESEDSEEQEYINYLMENDIDINSIIEEL